MLRSLVLVVALTTLSPFASACDGGGYGGLGLGFLYNSLEYRVPYFAALPPVYYSYPVPRTYGHSPFAYPPHFRTPEVFETSGPVMVNPFVPSSNEVPASTTESDRAVSYPQVSVPLVVDNPFCVQDGLAKN